MSKQEKAAVEDLELRFDNVDKMLQGIIKETKNLKLILLNLEIENSHIKTPTGIEPIAKNLEKRITQMEVHVQGFVENNEAEIEQSLNVLRQGLIDD